MSEADRALPYGLAADGRLVEVSQVKRGLACGCTCPRCERRLVAKKGEIVRHHFAHEAEADCPGAFETMAHMLAKQIIADAGRVRVPPLVAVYQNIEESVSPGREITINDVRLEVWRDGMRPDILARFGERELAIEVYVTHACTPEKLAMIAERGRPTFEIDLSEFRHGLLDDADTFDAAVLVGAKRRWLFNPRQTDADASLAAKTEARLAVERERQAKRVAQHVERMKRDMERAEAKWRQQATAPDQKAP